MCVKCVCELLSFIKSALACVPHANTGKQTKTQTNLGKGNERVGRERATLSRLAARCKVNKSGNQLFAVDAMWMPCVRVVSLSHSPVAPWVCGCQCLFTAASSWFALPGSRLRLLASRLTSLPASPCQPTAGQPFGFSWFFIAAPHARVSASLGFAQLADRIWSPVSLCFSVRFLNK